jgi:enamine deaminase RidA (YjgF/YER057c/UK114 family)
MKTARNPDAVHPPLAAYSHQIEVAGGERWLVMAGQVGMTPDGSIPEEPGAQFGVALENVLRNLSAAGMQAADLVKLTFYFVDEVAPAERAELLRTHLGAHEPCSTLVYVPRLARPALKVEVDAWAAA